MAFGRSWFEAVVRRPGVGDNDPSPDGSGTMTSLELVKKLAAKGADLNAAISRKVNLNNTRAYEYGATPFFLFLHFMDPHDPYMVHPFNGVGYARVAMPNPSRNRRRADCLRG